jgi:hypothetical protein
MKAISVSHSRPDCLPPAAPMTSPDAIEVRQQITAVV